MSVEKLYYTQKELCEELKVHRATLVNWQNLGMPYYKLGDSKQSRVRYKIDEVQEWINQRMVKMTKGAKAYEENQE